VQCGVCEIFWLTDWCVRTCGGVLVLHCSLWGLQKDINTFSRLNNQYHELKDELNTQKVSTHLHRSLKSHAQPRVPLPLPSTAPLEKRGTGADLGTGGCHRRTW